MTERTYFWSHSLTVTAPIMGSCLGLVLIVRKLFVTPGNQSAQVPNQHCNLGKGGGGGGREQRLSRNVARNKSFQSFVLKQLSN